MTKRRLLFTVFSTVAVLATLIAVIYWRVKESPLPGPALEEGIPGGSRPLPSLANQPSVTPTPDPISAKLSIQGDSDDPAAIVKDVNNTDFTVLDQESPQIEDLFTKP